MREELKRRVAIVWVERNWADSSSRVHVLKAKYLFVWMWGVVYKEIINNLAINYERLPWQPIYRHTDRQQMCLISKFYYFQIIILINDLHFIKYICIFGRYLHSLKMIKLIQFDGFEKNRFVLRLIDTHFFQNYYFEHQMNSPSTGDLKTHLVWIVKQK